MVSSTHKQFTLMNRTHPVCEVEYDTDTHTFSRILKLYEEGMRAPLGMLGMPIDKVHDHLNSWWKNRSIPKSRPYLEEALQTIGITSAIELAYLSHGLSLSDQYWIKEIDEDVLWEKINFFTNPFSDTVGRLIMHPTIKNIDLENLSNDPSTTSDGVLPKRWVVIDGIRMLMKGSLNSFQEPYNETIATMLHSSLLEESHYVTYTLSKDEDTVVSLCPNMLKDDEELISASSVQRIERTERIGTHTSPLEHYLGCCKSMGIPDARTRISEMIACDYIIANHDRHFGNFGIIRNVNTLKCRIAPIYDSGSCLWNQVRDLNIWDKSYVSKPFEEVPEQQLALVKEWDWYDPSRLDPFAFTEYIKETLSQGPFRFNLIRVDLISDFVFENIARIEKIREKTVVND